MADRLPPFRDFALFRLLVLVEVVFGVAGFASTSVAFVASLTVLWLLGPLLSNLGRIMS